MTRYVVIALMNLLVVASIAINAIIALIRGCNMDGTCSNGSGVLTWVLGVGLGIAVVVGGVMLFRYARQHHHVGATHRISIASLPKFARATAVDDEADTSSEADEAMLSRLARMTRAGAESEEIAHEETANVKLAEAPVAIDGPEIAEPIESLVTAKPLPDLHLVVRDGERTPHRQRHQPATESSAPLDWLFDTTATNAAQVRGDLGFPWCVAGIDHVCRGITQFGLALKDTDILPEASAWRSVTASLPRNGRLGDDDAAAFTEWLNVGLRLVGRNGRAMVAGAVKRLETEALGEAAMSACLPQQLRADYDPECGPLVRFG